MSRKPTPSPEPFAWKRHSFTGPRWPRNRTARTFLMLVPWIDLMACAVLAFCLARQTLVQPGRLVELPEAALEEGALATHPTAILRRLVSPDRADVTVLLLDEGRYTSDRLAELEALARVRPGEELNLIVDKAVTYGETLAWIERLRGSGVRRINLVAVPPRNAGGGE